jgi:hypothetical protein
MAVRRHAMSCNLIREGGWMDGWLSVCECRLGVDLLNPKRLAHFKLQNAYKRRRRRERSNLNLEIYI